MKVQRGHTVPKWWIAKSGTFVKYGKVDVGLEVRTGLDELIVYEFREEWLSALSLFNIFPDELTEL